MWHDDLVGKIIHVPVMQWRIRKSFPLPPYVQQTLAVKQNYFLASVVAAFHWEPKEGEAIM